MGSRTYVVVTAYLLCIVVSYSSPGYAVYMSVDVHGNASAVGEAR